MEPEHSQPNLSRISSSSSEYSTDEKSQGEVCDGTAVVKRHGAFEYLRYWIHLAAILVTAGLAALNILDVYLMDSDDAQANTTLNLFQFAAKAHETLIIGSIMLVMMDQVRTQLITAAGVPLGYILSPVLFNSLDWLLNTEFWSCAARSGLANLPLTIFIFTAIPFASLAGPLSAILVVPRLGWFKPAVAAAFPTFWNASTSSIFPNHITVRDVPTCAVAGAANGCPGAAVNTMFIETAADPSWSCLNKKTQMSCNATMQTYTWSVEYDFYSLTPVVSSPKAVIFSTLYNRVTGGIARPLNISNAQKIDAQRPDVLDINFIGNTGLFKPVVQAACRELSYSSIYQLYTNNTIDYNWSSPAAFWLKNIDNSSQASFVYSWLKNDSSLVDARKCQGQECFSSVACSVDARWVPVSLWYDLQQPDLLYQSDPQPSKLVESARFYDGVPITIDKDVLELFTPSVNINLSNIFRNVLNNLGVPMIQRPEDIEVFPDALTTDIFFVNFTQAIAMMLGTSVTEFLAEGPFHVGESIYTGNCSDTTVDFRFSTQICDQAPSDWIHARSIGSLQSEFSMVSFTLRRNGYGWFGDSITVKVALGILLLHALLTLLYLVYVINLRRQLTTCWSSAPELLMLAINSLRAPVLMGHSTGASGSASHLWQERVAIREFDSGEELSLVVGDALDYSGRVGDHPQLGKKYI